MKLISVSPTGWCCLSTSSIIPMEMSPSNGNAKRSHAQNLRHGKEVADCRLRTCCNIDHSQILCYILNLSCIGNCTGLTILPTQKNPKKIWKIPQNSKLIHFCIKWDPPPTNFGVPFSSSRSLVRSPNRWSPTPHHPGGPNLGVEKRQLFSSSQVAQHDTSKDDPMIHSDGFFFEKKPVSLFGKWWYKL